MSKAPAGSAGNPYYHAKAHIALAAFALNWRDFASNSSRREYWLAAPLIGFINLILFMVAMSHAWVAYALMLILAVPFAALLSRRYHDANMPGWLGVAQAVYFQCAGIGLLIADKGNFASKHPVIYLLVLLFGGFVNFIAIQILASLPTSSGTRMVKRSERITAYKQQHGLSTDDLAVLRDTMGTAKDQIIASRKLVYANKSLSTVAQETKGIRSAEAIFKELMAHPHEITDFDNFLYHKLPELQEAAQRYHDIQDDAINTTAVKESAEDIKATIRSILTSITNDYENIVREDAADIAMTRPQSTDGHHA